MSNGIKDIDRLYSLLPVSYRQRDLEEGSPLQMLLRVIAEQVNLVETNIDQLYNNWFIETCEAWVVPYIGDLIGYQQVSTASPDDSSPALDQILVPRRDVANTIRYRRRKGTLSLLEDLALGTSGWPAFAIEYGKHVAASVALDPQQSGGHYADLRSRSALDLLGGPFDNFSHTGDIHHVASPLSPGRYNSFDVGLLVGRLRAYSITKSLAYCQEEAGNHCFTFSILGNDAPLFTQPESSDDAATDETLPFSIPLRRIAFEHPQEKTTATPAHASNRYYGEGKSLAIWVHEWAGHTSKTPIPAEKIIPADLTDWRYRPRNGHIAVDPHLGRISFPADQGPKGDVRVSYFYGFAADIGGGEYSRPTIFSSSRFTLYQVGYQSEFQTIHSAYEHWIKQEPRPLHAVIEINDSGIYQEQLHLVIPENHELELRAADGTRPVLMLLDWHAGRPDDLTIAGEKKSRFTLEGILVTGRSLQIKGELEAFTIRHSTLVPGWGLHHDCRPRNSGEASLVLLNLTARVEIEHSILGGIRVSQESEDIDPIHLAISNSILDATHPDSYALGGIDDSIATAALDIRNCTVFGRLETHSIIRADNCIFTGEIRVARRQQGCMRFCYVSPDSRTPRRFHCQTDLVNQAAATSSKRDALSESDATSLLRAEDIRVKPQFRSTRYGSPDYCRLADTCAPEILAGAEDQSEMGVFHDLYQTQRTNNLRARLDEYTPASSDAGIIFVT